MTFWFDVEDLIGHFERASRPTGIQRLTFEIYREVWKAAGASGQVRFCRHGTTEADYIVVDWPELEAAILTASAAVPAGRPAGAALPEPLLAEMELEDSLGDAPPQDAPVQAAPVPPSANRPAPVPGRLNIWGKIHHYLYPRLTPTVRNPLGIIHRSQKQSLRAARDLVKALLLLLAKPSQPAAQVGGFMIRLSSEPVKFAPQDVFVSLGASWGLLNAAAGRHVQRLYGLRFAVLIHDLIPELYPEWTSREVLPSYRAWLRNVVPYADAIFTYSRHSAKDLLQRMADWNRPVPIPVVIPVGHHPPPRHAAPSHASADAPPEPAQTLFGRPFVLFVSTIEVRKNHALLFRVWRRLLASLPEAEVPYLVFAGKTAWLTGDLLVQMGNTDWLNGHIKLIESPAEPELMALYENCAFTVFPSLYEGWGLPVTESLSFGKTVAASNRAAIPEAGGEFCCYFDPENLEDAYAVIRGLIENPDLVRQKEALIAEKFRPPSWADTAAVLLAHLQSTERAAKPGPAQPQHQGSGVSPSVALTLA